MGRLELRVSDEFVDMLDEKRGELTRSEFLRVLVEGYGRDVILKPEVEIEVGSTKVVGKDEVAFKAGIRKTVSEVDKWKEDPYNKRILALREKAGRPISLEEEMMESVMPREEWDKMVAKRNEKRQQYGDKD